MFCPHICLLIIPDWLNYEWIAVANCGQLWFKSILGYRGSQRDVVYLGWPIAPSFMISNVDGEGCGVSANEYSCAHGDQMNFGDLAPLTYAGVETETRPTISNSCRTVSFLHALVRRFRGRKLCISCKPHNRECPDPGALFANIVLQSLWNSNQIYL